MVYLGKFGFCFIDFLFVSWLSIRMGFKKFLHPIALKTVQMKMTSRHRKDESFPPDEHPLFRGTFEERVMFEYEAKGDITEKERLLDRQAAERLRRKENEQR